MSIDTLCWFIIIVKKETGKQFRNDVIIVSGLTSLGTINGRFKVLNHCKWKDCQWNHVVTHQI